MDSDLSTIYDRLLAYPHETGEGELEVVVVRYIPADTSVETELAFRIVRRAGGAVSMEARFPSSASILEQLRALREKHPGECDDDLLKSIVLHDGTQVEAGMARRLLAEFHRLQMPTKLDSSIYLEAPRYEIEVLTPMNEMHLILYGPGRGARKMHPVIEWAETAVAQIRRAAGG